MSAPAEVVHRWFEEVWNQGRGESIDELLAPDAVIHGLGEGDLQGPQAFHQFHESFLKTFEQVDVTVDHVMEDGPMVTAWCTASVVHREEGAPATFSGSIMGRVEDGKIVEGWNVWDFLSVAVQLNVVDAERVGKLFGG